MDRRRLMGITLVVVSACSYGSGALFAKPVYGAGVDWLTLLCWRFLFGAVAGWAWLLASPRRRAVLGRLSRQRVAASLGLGIVFVANTGTYFKALETVPASLAALIVYIYPAVVAVLSLRFARSLPGRRPWIALAIALSGVALALGGMGSAGAPPLDGLIVAIASPLCYAVWIILAARFGGERPAGATTIEPDGPREAMPRLGGPEPDAVDDASAAMAIMMTATAACYWAVALAAGEPVAPWVIPAAAWPGLLGVGVVSAALAVHTFYAGALRIGAAQASLVSTIEPIWTIALAALLFGERLGPIQLVGGGLIIAAVLIAQSGPHEPQPTLRLADE